MEETHIGVYNSSTTSMGTTLMANSSENGPGENLVTILVGIVMMALTVTGKGGNVLLFRVTKYLIQKKQEAG